jgi:hypothetical protein
MKHVQDQDLLLLAHRSLSPWDWFTARYHLWRCNACRRRYDHFRSLSTSVASAVRVGLRPWRPIGLSIKVVLLVGLILVTCGVIGTEIVAISAPTERPAPYGPGRKDVPPLSALASKDGSLCKTPPDDQALAAPRK